jgi:crotonobetaine/carnitine-CoA ligase
MTVLDLAGGRNMPWLVETWARRRPDHPFLVWEPFEDTGRSWTYSEFARDTASLAAGLRAGGVRPGDRVMVHMENCPEFVLTWFACASIGATAVCTNTKSSPVELAYFGEHAGVVAAVTEPRFAADVEAVVRGAQWVAVTGEAASGSLPFAGLFADPDSADGSAPPDATTAVSIQYTSGTTARPKAVVWTHANALFGAKMSAAHEALGGSDVQLVHLPLFHTNAQMYSMLATLWAGATAVLQPRFSASRFWDVALRHRCTFSSVVPFCVKALAAQGDAPKHHFRLWGSGVSRPPEDDLFGVTTIGWFGMTETVTHCTVDDPEHPGRRGGMGRPAPEYGVRLVDDDGRQVRLEEPGHLEVLGVPGLSLFAGYLGDEAATASSFTDDGWFITGDLARAHPDGHLSFAGREKDMMKVGGENVAAAEVEAVIMALTGVTEVAVVGKPDHMLSEVPVAYVIASVPSDELRDGIDRACRDALASFKVPREIRFVDELPRATLNKVAKVQLRQELADEVSRAAARHASQ